MIPFKEGYHSITRQCILVSTDLGLQLMDVTDSLGRECHVSTGHMRFALVFVRIRIGGTSRKALEELLLCGSPCLMCSRMGCQTGLGSRYHFTIAGNVHVFTVCPSLWCSSNAPVSILCMLSLVKKSDFKELYYVFIPLMLSQPVWECLRSTE